MHDNKNMNSTRILITGSSSGGHIFPGVAVADQLYKMNPETEIFFFTTGSLLEEKIFKNFKYNTINISTHILKRKNRISRLIFETPKLILKASKILNKFKPNLVISVGGYYAGPVGVAAIIKNIPLVICEQNVCLGLTNALLSIFASRIYTSFKKTNGLINNKKVFFYGNPVRRQIINKNKINHFQNSNRKKANRKFNIFILGGSQGAHAINVALLSALEHIKNVHNIKFIHQTGIEDVQLVKNTYSSQKIDAIVAPFFNKIAPYYKQANMVICRAGGTTIAELTAIGKCSILIPYPFATGNHQLLNAQTMVNAKAAVMILQKNLNGTILAQHIENFISNPEIVDLMQLKAKKIGSPKAAELIAANINKILK